MNNRTRRQQLLDYARRLNSDGLSTGQSGNISLRCETGLLITPSGIDYAEMNTDDMVLLNNDGTLAGEQQRAPSSEWHFHCDLYEQDRIFRRWFTPTRLFAPLWPAPAGKFPPFTIWSL